MQFFLSPYFAHAFGARYELPIPLLFFVLGGAVVVLISFLFVLPRAVKKSTHAKATVKTQRPLNVVTTFISFFLLAALIACGLFGSQEVAENIVPTTFWLLVWIAIPLSCGIIGNWTEALNPFANIAKLADNMRLRKLLLGQEQSLKWSDSVGYWPAVVLFFTLACGELIYNQAATLPHVTATGLLIYVIVSAFAGLAYGPAWLQRGEVFSVLFASWGKLGYFRFGALGRRAFAGGLDIPFEPHLSHNTFILLLLVSVSFDGLTATPLWAEFQHNLPSSVAVGTGGYSALATLLFALLALIMWLLFSGFAAAVKWVGRYTMGIGVVLAGLLPSLLPISFGYLLAHNIEYLIVNSQLLFPLIGNPIGLKSWPVHLPYPFNDAFEPNPHVLPSAFFWYFSVLVIIFVHIIAVVLAHRHLAASTKKRVQARRSEYPWIVAMIGYTMLSLWLLAQPLVQEKPSETSSSQQPPHSTVG